MDVPDVAAPKSPPAGLLVAGVFELPNSVDDPEFEVAAPLPNKPPAGVFEPVFVVLPALPKMDEAPPAPAPAPAPNKGVVGVLLPPPGWLNLKAIVRECVECAGESFGCVRTIAVL